MKLEGIIYMDDLLLLIVIIKCDVKGVLVSLKVVQNLVGGER